MKRVFYQVKELALRHCRAFLERDKTFYDKLPPCKCNNQVRLQRGEAPSRFYAILEREIPFVTRLLCGEKASILEGKNMHFKSYVFP